MRKDSTGYKNRPKKRFGQNFLIDNNIIERIIEASEISSDDIILEIGPGRGALTGKLLSLADQVIAVEIDWDLAAYITDSFPDADNLSVIREDFLKTDMADILPRGRQIKVVANLPYYITTPILMKLLESDGGIERIVVMVQREVALRMCAQSGTADYGALSLAVEYYSLPSIVTDVPAACFYPAPKVDSCVVMLRTRPHPCDEVSEKELFKCIHAAFGQRRKTLINALAAGDIIDKENCRNLIEGFGWDINIRGERLSLEDYIILSQRIMSLKESR